MEITSDVSCRIFVPLFTPPPPHTHTPPSFSMRSYTNNTCVYLFNAMQQT